MVAASIYTSEKWNPKGGNKSIGEGVVRVLAGEGTLPFMVAPSQSDTQQRAERLAAGVRPNR